MQSIEEQSIRVKTDPYGYLRDLIAENPETFDLSYYIFKYDLDKEVPKWASIKNNLIEFQAIAKAQWQRKKPGICFIDRGLIERKLSVQQLKTFDTHPCFQLIVDHLNQIPRYGSNRPHKTLNLYLWGAPGIGKTSLFNGTPDSLASITSTYDFNLQNRYQNRYTNNAYGFISWHEFVYTAYPHVSLVKLFEGLDLQIPVRYSSNIKRDNPLIVMTSNISLSEHIEREYKGDPRLTSVAKSSLVNQRISEVYVPVPMFFMQKLLVKKQ